MNQRFKRPYNQANYQRDREAMQDRFSQPQQGNYRVDRSGNPIRSYGQAIDDRDYFDREKSINQGSPSLGPSNMNTADYQKRQSVWQERNQQPENYDLYASSRTGNYRFPQRQKQLDLGRRGPNRPINTWYYRWQQQHQKNTKNRVKPMLPLPENRLHLLAVFILLFFAYLYTGWQLMPMQRLNQLSVSGNHYINEATILKASRLDPLDRYDAVMQQKPAIEAKIKEEIPMIEQVEFSRDSWQNLDLKVVEYDMVALMRHDNKTVPVLSNGELLAETNHPIVAGNLSQNLPLLVNFDQKGKVVDLTNNSLRNLSPDLLSQISEIELSKEADKPNTIYVKMADGNRVQAIINTFAQKMKYYNQMVSQVEGQQGTFNLEVGAYFIPDTSANSVKLDNN